MKKLAFFLLLIIANKSNAQKKEYLAIGYITPKTDIMSVPYKYLTHLNYSFAIPAKSGDSLEPLKNTEYIKELIKTAHNQNVKVFLSVGGWGIGDGGGDDSRFHRLAETPAGQTTFINSVIKAVNTFGFDGVDLDWEYPDPDHRSADDFVELSKQLYQALHLQNKKLTAAVVSAGKQAYGIKEEVYPYMDWLNIMVYDGDYGPSELKHHSPYSMSVKCIDFWLNERNLPASKCVLGLPFYAKKGFGNFGYSYKKLLEEGASHYDDYWNGHFYNGTITIANKTKLAMQMNLAGVMVWEASHDTQDDRSLFKVIYDTLEGNR